MDKFKTLEEAQAAYDKLFADNKSLSEQKAALEGKVKLESDRANEAEKIALEMNSKLEELDKFEDIIVTIKSSKYRINYGVDGLSKEELKSDKKLLEQLVAKQSGALTKVD